MTSMDDISELPCSAEALQELKDARHAAEAQIRAALLPLEFALKRVMEEGWVAGMEVSLGTTWTRLLGLERQVIGCYLLTVDLDLSLKAKVGDGIVEVRL